MSVADVLDARLWEPGSSAFWLDPDRWFGVPFGKDGRLEPFWLHLHDRPRARKTGLFQTGPMTPWPVPDREPVLSSVDPYRVADYDGLDVTYRAALAWSYLKRVGKSTEKPRELTGEEIMQLRSEDHEQAYQCTRVRSA